MEEEFLQRVMCSIPIGQVECDRYVEKVLSNQELYMKTCTKYGYTCWILHEYTRSFNKYEEDSSF